MKKETDPLWYLGALIPACITFGPHFLFEGKDDRVLSIGLFLILMYIAFFHKRIEKLEKMCKNFLIEKK